MPYILAGLEDRNADVRKAAGEAVFPFMLHLGYEGMMKHTSRVKVPTCMFEAVRKYPGYGMATLIYNNLLNLILGTVMFLGYEGMMKHTSRVKVWHSSNPYLFFWNILMKSLWLTVRMSFLFLLFEHIDEKFMADCITVRMSFLFLLFECIDGKFMADCKNVIPIRLFECIDGKFMADCKNVISILFECIDEKFMADCKNVIPIRLFECIDEKFMADCKNVIPIRLFECIDEKFMADCKNAIPIRLFECIAEKFVPDCKNVIPIPPIWMYWWIDDALFAAGIEEHNHCCPWQGSPKPSCQACCCPRQASGC